MIQSVYGMAHGPKSWTPASLRAWIIAEGMKPTKPAERVGDEIRFRLRDPRGFSRFRTKVLKNGVHLTLGFRDKPKSTKKKRSANR